MNVAYTCPDRGIPLLGTKGASVHVRAITAALNARGHHVHVLCAQIGEGNPPPAVAEIRHCETDRDIDRALDELAASSCLDVVLERYSLDSGAARRTSTRWDVPQVLEVNAPLVLEAARWRGLTDVTRRLANERAAFQAADAVVVVSRALAAYVEAAAPQTATHWVPNGATIDRIAGAEQPIRGGRAGSATVVGFTGSMKRWHGLHSLLDAFALVHARHPKSVLVLAGSGPEEAALRERVNTDRHLRDCVFFAGAVLHDDIPALLASFDIGVAPYLASEDFFYFAPLKVIEYLAAGLPVIHPRLGDLCETVADAGIAYDASTSTGLAGALEQMLTDPGLRRRCAAAARSRAPAFSWDATAAAVEGVLRAVLGARSVEASR